MAKNHSNLTNQLSSIIKQIYIRTMQNNSYYPYANQYHPRMQADYQLYRIQQIYHHQRMQIPGQNFATLPYGYRPNTEIPTYYSSLGSPAYPFNSQIPYFNRDYQAFGRPPNHQIRYDPPNFINYRTQHPYSQIASLSQRRPDQLQDKPIIVLSDDSHAQDEQNKTLKNQNSTHESISKQKLLQQQSLQKNLEFRKNWNQSQKKIKSQGKPYFQMNKQKSQILSTHQNIKQLKQLKQLKQFKKQSTINSSLISIEQRYKKSKIYSEKQKVSKDLQKTKRIVKATPRKIQQKQRPKFTPIDRPRRNLSKKTPGLQLQNQPKHKEPAPKILIGQQYQAELPQFFIDKRDQVLWIELKKQNLFSRLQKNGQNLVLQTKNLSKDQTRRIQGVTSEQ